VRVRCVCVFVCVCGVIVRVLIFRSRFFVGGYVAGIGYVWVLLVCMWVRALRTHTHTTHTHHTHTSHTHTTHDI